MFSLLCTGAQSDLIAAIAVDVNLRSGPILAVLIHSL